MHLPSCHHHLKKKKVKVLVVQLCLTLCDPTYCSPPGSSVCGTGILQARILECVAIPFSRRSSQPRNRTQVSCIAGRFFTIWVTREAPFTQTVLSPLITPTYPSSQRWFWPHMEPCRVELWLRRSALGSEHLVQTPVTVPVVKPKSAYLHCLKSTVPSTLGVLEIRTSTPLGPWED